jgi:hypothetical protein
LPCRCDFEGHAYILNTSYSNQRTAESACQMNGGHLVGYEKLEEQVAVEQCFISQGFLLPKFHVHYWMGLISGLPGAMWPNFTWIDHNEAIYRGNYQHWGTAGKDLEPNNLVPNEFCAGSNVTVMYTNAGGWADHNCREPYVYICEVGNPLSYPAYTAPGSNATFTFFSTPMTFDAAEAACNVDGGHLATYSDLQEQVRWLHGLLRCWQCPRFLSCAACTLAWLCSPGCSADGPLPVLQSDVETFYTEKGWMLPRFHKSYWIGLKTAQWPSFK